MYQLIQTCADFPTKLRTLGFYYTLEMTHGLSIKVYPNEFKKVQYLSSGS